MITPLKSKLWSSNPFSSANVTNEDRRQIVGKWRQKIARFNSENSETVGQKFTKFGRDVPWLFPLNPLKADLRSANPLSNAEAKSNEHFPYLTGCHSNIPWTTAKRILGKSSLLLTKFSRGVQKWLPISLLKSKLWYSNPFQNASMPNERKSSNFGRVAAQFSFSPPL